MPICLFWQKPIFKDTKIILLLSMTKTNPANEYEALNTPNTLSTALLLQLSHELEGRYLLLSSLLKRRTTYLSEPKHLL